VADVAERPAQGGHRGKRHGTVVKPGFVPAIGDLFDLFNFGRN
jgi:hypothetical protein